MKRINQMLIQGQTKAQRLRRQIKSVLANTDGDQITGWLIVILLVVVVGAFFLKTYQGSIIEIWNGIVDKAKQTFGI